MKDLKDKVEYCLKAWPLTRNSDELLWTYVILKFYPRYTFQTKHNHAAIELRTIVNKSVPDQDDVKRLRAKFNEEDLYFPTDRKVAKGRKISEDRWRKVLGYPSTEATIHPSRRTSYTERINAPNPPEAAREVGQQSLIPGMPSPKRRMRR